jgi:hypothetical protein
LTELTFQVAIRTDPRYRHRRRRPLANPAAASTDRPTELARALLEPLHLRILLPAFFRARKPPKGGPPSDGLNAIVPPQPRQTSVRDETGRPAHLGAECPLPVKASVHGEALHALTSDDVEASCRRGVCSRLAGRNGRLGFPVPEVGRFRSARQPTRCCFPLRAFGIDGFRGPRLARGRSLNLVLLL